MTKGIRFLGKNKEGKDIIEYYDVPDVEPTKLTPEDYPRLVTEFIREKYSIDEEMALAAKHRECFLSLHCSEAEGVALKIEAIAFEAYRGQCKDRARKACGMPPKAL